MFVQFTFGLQKYIFDGFWCLVVYSEYIWISLLRVRTLRCWFATTNCNISTVNTYNWKKSLLAINFCPHPWSIELIYEKLGITEHFATLCLPLNCISLQKIVKTSPFFKNQEALDSFLNDLNILLWFFRCAQNLDIQFDKLLNTFVAVIVQHTLIKIATKPKNAWITSEVDCLV